MFPSSRVRLHGCALLAYVAVAVAFTWPLATHLNTHLTGGVGGDTGVYVWNQWVFRHELIEKGNFPYFTDTLFGAQRPANLSLHNYTRFQNLIATPLMRFLSVVAAFNVVYLLMVVLTAYTTFLLAKQVTGRAAEAWLAGLLFAWGPTLATRGMGAFSLVAAAPLAVFLLILMRADGHERLRDAVALGVVIGWASSTDAYYGIYCLLIGAIFLIARVVSIHPSPRAGRARAVLWGLDVLILGVAGLVVSMAVTGGWELTFLGRPLRMRSLYTPMLILTTLGVARIGWQYRASWIPVTRDDLWRFARLAAATALVTAAVMSPVLYAAAMRLGGGDFTTPHIFWRSSPPGLDLAAFFLPNPNHPLAPHAIEEWITKRPNGFIDNVASIPFVALVVLAIAWRAGWRPSRWWAAVTALFGLFALGPFINVAGINTYVPGPWALLRFVPLVSLARSPGRFAVVMMLTLAVLVAMALVWLGRAYPHRRRAILAVTGVLLAFELLPAPMTLHSAKVPAIYDHVAAAPAGTTVLELPYGIRDGASNIGDFSARTQFFQTAHGKTVMGGYLSRVSARRITELRADPVRHALALLSEKRHLTNVHEVALVRQGPAFIRRFNIGFVVFDLGRTSDEFRGLVIKAFRLQHVETDDVYALYAPDPQR
jgi:hypothetical protein